MQTTIGIERSSEGVATANARGAVVMSEAPIGWRPAVWQSGPWRVIGFRSMVRSACLATGSRREIATQPSQSDRPARIAQQRRYRAWQLRRRIRRMSQMRTLRTAPLCRNCQAQDSRTGKRSSVMRPRAFLDPSMLRDNHATSVHTVQRGNDPAMVTRAN
jgi:hypothetical protein